ncbi:hypothetical protein BCR37DRAFT_196144 [Protomyces lactucae-debilis]|uniref:CUE domain-containing protein n=1 Tax=Protomyces lactucae-debilis TaxID=2754530 RepID=A0A1Y2ETG0_PROLT|nr:uncharacterized protein BCR37DRAFT_196144 [Protomyces lactucae-debilis]ORY74848.1 hypothetical protein BCR37DRAFT_196144 [Protomyces lactucae-debilis]
MSTSPAKEAAATFPTTPVAPPKKAPADPNVETLQAAFPDIDAAVISAVLMASGQNLERSFDALLGMSDPNHKPDMPAPAPTLSAEQQQQIEADEELARQIGIEDRAYRKFAKTQRQRQQGEANANHEPERSFLDDELPVIKETIIQGFNETKTKVSGFLANLKEQYATQFQEAPPSTSAAPRASFDRQSRGEPDRPRASMAYEADPDAVAVLDEDFNELELHDATTVKPSKPTKPTSANSQEAAKARAQSASKWEKIEPQKKATPAPLSDRDNFDIGDE